MREAIIHVGHGKTGTSLIQSVLSLNTEKLLAAGIYYPYDKNFEDARLGKVTSGNFIALYNESFKFSSKYKTLISGENLFHLLALDGEISRLVLSKIDRLKVILYSRNVMEFLYSAWGQFVKYHGEVRSFQDFILHHHDIHHERVLTWIELAEKYNFELILRNYSTQQGGIIQNFIEVIKNSLDLNAIDLKDLKIPFKGYVNASFERSDYAILRAINTIDPKISVELSNKILSLGLSQAITKDRISVSLFEKVGDRYKINLEKMNLNFPDSQKIRFGEKISFIEEDENKIIASEAKFQFICEMISEMSSSVRS